MKYPHVPAIGDPAGGQACVVAAKDLATAEALCRAGLYTGVQIADAGASEGASPS